jgi:hypothetical protein
MCNLPAAFFADPKGENEKARSGRLIQPEAVSL